MPILTNKGKILIPQLFGQISRYILVAAAGGRVAVAPGQPYNKRMKQVHRYTISDANGIMDLTVPVEKPLSAKKATWNSVRISRHGEWWNVHRTALESAYGRTPFFEFYIDRLLPFMDSDTPDRFSSIAELAVESEKKVLEILFLPQPAISPENADCFPGKNRELPPYWQLRQDRFGFIPDLSVLDLIFSLGPESALYIDRLKDNPIFAGSLKAGAKPENN